MHAGPEQNPSSQLPEPSWPRRALQAGYYCSVCDCILRDSMSYLDHINGKYHNRALGMTMRVERSNADQVSSPHPHLPVMASALPHA